MESLDLRQWPARPGVAGRLGVPKGSIYDELLIKALQPLSILQIGMERQLLGRCRGQVTVCEIRSLDQALGLLAGEDFDVIVLGPDSADAWPTSAYERIAEAADSTPVVVTANPVKPMIMVKQRQDRADDMIVSSAAPTLVLERMILTAVLRSRALAASPATQVG